MHGNGDYKPEELLEEMQAVLRDSDLLLDCQKRVAQVVDYCVSNVLSAEPKENHVAEYAKELGKGLEKIWLYLVEQCPVLDYLGTRIPYGVLYVNSLGIKWRLFHSGRPYDYRVAAYIGSYFQNNPNTKLDEDKYNEGIFSNESRHLLYLTCTSKKPGPMILRNRDIDNYVPQQSSAVCVEVPKWGGSEADLDTVKDPKLGSNHTKLNSCFDWLNGNEEKQLLQSFTKAGLETGQGRIDILCSIFNLYRGWARVGQNATYPVTHYVYIPDLILPGFAPAGFAGPLCLDCFMNAPDKYDLLLSELRTFFSRYFGHALQASESEIIHVSMEEELRGKETWKGKYVTTSGNITDYIPLISDLSELSAATPVSRDAVPEKVGFNQEIAYICKIISDQFSSRACPKTASVNSVEDAAKLIPPESGFPDDVLRSPIFGYHALSRRALTTIKEIWVWLGILVQSEDDTVYSERLLYKLVERLLGFEPTLHYFPGYRDHFIHSFNSFLLGLWLLQCKDQDSNFLILPEVKLEEEKPKEKRPLSRERLLRLWVIAAPLHDIAYPVQKLEAGINELFRQYTVDGCQEIHDFNLFPAWSTGITKPHYYAFFHESLSDVATGDSISMNGSIVEQFPLMYDRRTRLPVSATLVSAELAKRLIDKGDHSVWGALFVRNYLYKPVTGTNLPERRSGRLLDEKDEQDICFAIACHHIWEMWETKKKVQWKLSHGHPLTYLLTLVDALSQWGRTREVRLEEEGKDEEEKEARLVSIQLQKLEKRNRIMIIQHYPNATDNGEMKKWIDKYTGVPLEFLSTPEGESVLEVRFFDKTWDGDINAPDVQRESLLYAEGRTSPKPTKGAKAKPKPNEGAKAKPKPTKAAKAKPKPTKAAKAKPKPTTE